MDQAPAAGSSDVAYWTFIALATALLPIMVLASRDFGATWDEKARQINGELIAAFLRGKATRADFGEDGGQLYGGLFDLICVAVQHWLPVNAYVVRHAINAIFGWIGIVFAGRLAMRLFGGWAGVLALVLLALSPRYFGESMNNPKDLPFAALSVVALYYFSTMSSKWPYLSGRTAVKIVFALALALNIRAGALLYLGYFGVLVAAFVLAERQFTLRRISDTAVRVALVTAAILPLGTLFWPWAQAAPFSRPIQAFLGFANFAYGGLVLFNGREYDSMQLPWHYAPVWLLISTPPVIMLGAVLALAPGGPGTGWRKTALAVAVGLPVLLVIVNRSTLYDGIRHLLFVYPVIVVLAAAGWAEWLSTRRARWIRGTMAVLLAAGLANILAFDVRAYPNQTVYFNEFVGGPRGAFARYDLDYWGNCMLDAVAWSAKAARLAGRPVNVSGFPAHLVQIDSGRFPQLIFKLPQENQHHLTIGLNRGPIGGVTALARREDALYRTTTPDGAVLCVVFPGPAFAELRPYLPAAPPNAKAFPGP